MHEREVGEVVAAHGVADADEWPWHLRAFGIDEVQEIAGVVVPAWVVAEMVFVEDTGGTLVSHVSYP